MTCTTTLTRQELYERVWQTPMVRLAAEYGLSGRGLAKLCERHAIPVPGRGHWALTRAGYEMERDPLPADPPPETQVSITGDPGKDKGEHPDVAAQIAYERGHPIVVPDHLTRPHPLIAQARSSLRPRVPGNEGVFATRGNPLPIRVSANQIPRALRFFDSLLRACEERRFAVKASEETRTGLKIEVHGEKLSVGIDETNRRSDHVLTAREEADRKRGHGWAIQQYDYTPSGVFTFTIHEYTDGLQHRWSDRKNRPLESRLNEIIVALVRIAVTVLKPRHLRWQQEELRRHEAEKRWLEEQARLRLLNKNLEAWRTNQELRSFLAAVEKTAAKRLGSIAADTPIALWLDWAHDLADRGDPLENFVSELAAPAGSG